MKAFLMDPQHDFDLRQPLPWNARELVQDLELETLFQAMAQDDEFIHAVVERAVLCSQTDTETLRYRQRALRDCFSNAQTVREIYRLAAETVEKEKKHFHFSMRHPGVVLRRAVEVLQMFVEQLKALRKIAERNADSCRVAAGSYLPAAPTDPVVPNSGNRLLESSLRCTTVNTVHDTHGGQRIAGK